MYSIEVELSKESIVSSFLSPCYGNHSILIEKLIENGLVFMLVMRARAP